MLCPDLEILIPGEWTGRPEEDSMAAGGRGRDTRDGLMGPVCEKNLLAMQQSCSLLSSKKIGIDTYMEVVFV